MRSGNPALNDNVFTNHPGFGSAETMTIQGTVNKSFILLACVLLTAGWVWSMVMQPVDPYTGQSVVNVGKIKMLGAIGLIGGLILGFVTIFKPVWSPVTAPAYALLQGLFLGGLSAFMERMYPGIVIQAVALTMGTLLCLLGAYTSRLIQVTENFKLGIVAATGGIMLVYIATIVLGLFGIQIPMIHESGMVGIGFSLFVVVIAALNLVLDFDFIENASERGAAKDMEWYGAFGLMMTLIWLYIEILRLLAKLRSR